MKNKNLHLAKPKHHLTVETDEHPRGRLYHWEGFQYGKPIDLSELSWEPRILKHKAGYDQEQDNKQTYKGGKKLKH